MDNLLWGLQIALAVMFGAAGSLKALKPRKELVATLGGWVDDFPAPLLKPLGFVEVLAAVGLVVPPWIDLLPVLTPLAASGLVVVMVGAVLTHARRNEFPQVAVNVVLGATAAFVAWQRFGPHSF